MRQALTGILLVLWLVPAVAGAQTGKIQVMATAEVDMLPDGATLTVSLHAEDVQEAVARQKAEAQAAEVEQAIKDLNVPRLVSGERRIRVQPYWMSNGHKLTSVSFMGRAAPDNPAGFDVFTTVCAVIEHEAGKARELVRPVSQALKERELYPSVSYSWDDTERWGQAAIAEATARAIAAAGTVAKAGAVKITSFEYFGFTAPGQRRKPEEVGPKVTIATESRSAKATCTIWAVAVY